jgi:glucose-1-phosphate thymidylyltransferase
LSNGEEFGLDRLSYAYQERPGGIAEALGLSERFVGDDRVVVMLADNIFERSIKPSLDRFVASDGEARLLLAQIEDVEHLRHLGVPEIGSDGRIVRIIEKPADPPSNYCVTGVYLYPPDVFQILPTLEPSGRGELEITDVNNHYVSAGTMAYDVIEGYWGDAGESIDAYYAVNDQVRRHGANRP